jgi:DNA uptake protein ComE-like DNA-binding protein
MTSPPFLKSGFALPTVLTVTTILTLIFIVCIVALQGLTSQVLLTANDVDLLRQAYSAEAEASFLLITEPLNNQALKVGGRRSTASDLISRSSTPRQEEPWTPLKFDGRPYVWTENSNGAAPYRLSLQDEAGLANIDVVSPQVIATLLIATGMSVEKANRLAAEMRDYVSTDQAISVEGVTPAAYVAAGLPSPLQRPARTLSDVSGVLDWERMMPVKTWRQIEPFVAAVPDSRVRNINTAPMEVLMAQYGISREKAQDVVARREKTPLVDITEIGLQPDSEFSSYVFPNGRFKFRFVDPRTGSSYTSVLVMTPGDALRPVWAEDARTQHGLGPLVDERANPGPFPQISR